MIELLFALCVGLVNAGRGSGIRGGKVYLAITMWVLAWVVTQNPYATLLFPLPQFLFFWQKGGTGVWHQPVISKLSFLGLKDNTWRFFEFATPFIYSLIFFIIWQQVIITSR